MPTLPVSTHDWQVLLQSLSQQTLCEQLPELHSPPIAHETPFCFLPQAVPRQVLGARQSAVDVATVQAILHADTPSHRNGSQCPVVAALQCPTPSQVRGGVRFAVPLGQMPAAHCVAVVYKWQAPLPSQNPSVPQVEAAVVAQRPSTSPWVGGTFEQVPSVVPGNAHDLHVPWQALPQQTPCSQKPDAHSLAPPQVAPIPLSTQAVPLQVAGETQSAALVAGAQLVLQTPLVLSQANDPAQVPVVGGWQVPAPSQMRAEVNVAPVQALATQGVVAA